MFLHKGIILGVQALAQLLDIGLAAAVHLHIQQLAGRVADTDNAGHALGIGFADVSSLFQRVTLLAVQLAVLDHDTAVFALGRIGLDLGSDLLLSALHRVVHLALDLAERLFNLLFQISGLCGIGQTVATVHTAGGRSFTQHHFGVLGKVIVGLLINAQLLMVVIGGFKGFTAVFRAGFTLFQHQNISDNLGSGVALKGAVRQTDRAQQVGPLHDVLAHRAVAGVHRITAGDKTHNAAGAHLVQALGKEIVVNGAGNRLGIGLVSNTVVAKRHVADRHIHVIVRDFGRFKALHTHIGVGVQILCDIAGDAVQLHHRPGLHTRQHILGHSTGEVTHACAGLQQSAALKAQTGKALINAADNADFGIVSVQSRALGAAVFLVGKQTFQFLKLLFPVGLVGIKDICQTAPAHILGQDGLLLCGSIAIFSHDLAQGLDGGHVGLVACLFALGQLQTVLWDGEVTAARVLLHSLLGLLLDLLAYSVSISLQVSLPQKISFGIRFGYRLQVMVFFVHFLHFLHSGNRIPFGFPVLFSAMIPAK